MKNKLKRVLNGALALVMCMSTFTAVSYVKPMTADAANGNQEWYNPALRWKETKNYRENILIANSVVSTENQHCQNAECPSNRIDGFRAFLGGYTFYPVRAYKDGDKYRENIWEDTDGDGYKECIGNILTYTFEKYGITYYWADEKNKQGKLPDTRVVTSELVDDEGKWVGGGNNTGTHVSMTQFTTYRVPEYTATGKSYMKQGASKYGYSSPVSKEKCPTRKDAADYFGVDPDDVIYLERCVTKGNAEGYAEKWGEGYAAVGYMRQYTEDGKVKEAFMPDWKITSPRKGGQYTGCHFTASYCNSCGLWGTADNDVSNTQINNCSFMLNECKVVYPGDTGVSYGDDTALESQTGLECEVSRTYASEPYNADNQYHKVLDATLPMCLYCFGTPAVEKEEQYHFHKHSTRITGVDVVSPNAIAIRRQCLADSSIGNHHKLVGVDEDGDGKNDKFIDENCSTFNRYTERFKTEGKRSVVTRDAADPIGISGCGYEETNYYTALKTVQDYIGVVDGKEHYVSFNGEEVVNSGDGYFIGNEDNNELEATVEWFSDAARKHPCDPPHKLVSGTSTAYYTITYKLPWSLRKGIKGEVTEENKDAATSDAFINKSDADKEIVYNGIATVTLVPQNYANEDGTINPNYAGKGPSITDTLLGNLTFGQTGNLSGVSGSAGIDGKKVATYDAYEPSWDDHIGAWVIEMGDCNNSGTKHKYKKVSREVIDNETYDIWACTVCNEELYILVGVNTVHVHHYYKYDEIPATCNTKGMIFRRCVCGAMETEDTAINPGNHVGTTHKVDPAATCENVGYEYDECVGCGAKLNGQQIEKLGHQWTTTGITNNFGHVPNYVIQTCERCNKKKTISSNGISEDEIFVDGAVDMSSASHTAHDYRYRYTERECENGTYEIWQCSVCSEIERRLVESGKGHIWIEQGDKRDSTCTVNGYRNYICSNCGSYKLEMLPLDKDAHKHTVRTFSRPESEKCTHSFVEYETCTACNKTVNVVQNHDPLGHDYKVLLDTKATCHEMGHHVEQCLRCYNVVQEDTPVQDHNYVPTGTISESQCTVDGLRELACEYCGDLKYESIGMTGHTPGKEATCTEDQVCTVCGAVLEKAKAPSFPMTL